MIRYTLALVIFLMAQSAFSYHNFSGDYICHGEDPYLGTKYEGKLSIEQQHTVYKLKMAYSTGEVMNGTAGLFNPETLSVVFQDTKDHKKTGLERYSLSDDKNIIQGYWVYLGEHKIGKEWCKRITSSKNNK